MRQINTKGITLVEVMVSMGLFAVLATIIVGAFVLVLNMKSLITNMKESQQKTRMALELISRLARQADEVIIYDSSNFSNNASQGDVVDLYFTQVDPTYPPITRFRIGTLPSRADITLYTQECISWTSGKCDTNGWSEPNDLMGGNISLQPTLFAINLGGATNPNTLSIILDGRINNINANPYYSNTFTIDNKVILENFR